jgi:hypothetical protein
VTTRRPPQEKINTKIKILQTVLQHQPPVNEALHRATLSLKVKIPYGSLSPIVRELVEDCLISECDDLDGHSGRPLRLLHVTELGRAFLQHNGVCEAYSEAPSRSGLPLNNVRRVVRVTTLKESMNGHQNSTVSAENSEKLANCQQALQQLTQMQLDIGNISIGLGRMLVEMKALRSTIEQQLLELVS